MTRYDGKPFLRLLECYILDSIGQLADRHRDSLLTLEPQLREVYGMPGTWSEIVAAQMDFPDTLPAQIRKIWHGYQESVGSRNADPEAFAVEFIDRNFPDLLA